MALTSLALAVSTAAWTPAGHADGGRQRGLVCTGESDSVYDPPLTLSARETSVHTEARYACTVAPGRTVPATGVLDAVTADASCITLTSTHATETVRYGDGHRSVILYDQGTTTRVVGALNVILSGRVTQGRGQGLSARRSVAARPGQLPTECLSSGLRGSTGGAQLEIQP
ncbi:hypothetical protein [Streptomyces cinnamoneus]|uniref:hypothetical protein n=1 Tax=Streptomyces cinnamoneus TaxID=53446 RepID=UPI0019608F89|nr:hypothetical protein [Streptomyces cinnamoneus]